MKRPALCQVIIGKFLLKQKMIPFWIRLSGNMALYAQEY